MGDAIGSAMAGTFGLYLFLVIASIVTSIATVVCIFVITHRTRLMSMNMYTLYEQNEELLERVRNIEASQNPSRSENRNPDSDQMNR